MLTVSADQTMILWDGTFLRPLFTYVEKDYDVDGVAWNPNENSFLSWGNDKRIVCWNVMEAEGKCIFEASDMLTGKCVQWCGTEKCVVYDKGKIIYIDSNGICKNVTFVDTAIQVAFSDRGNYLAIIQKDGLAIYAMSQMDNPIIWKVCKNDETSNLVFAPNEKDFIFFNNQTLWIYRSERWYKIHVGKVKDIVWSTDGKYFYTCGKVLKRYKTYNLKSVKSYTHIQSGDIICVSPTGDKIFVGQGVCLYLYDVESGRLLKKYCGEDRRICDLCVDVGDIQIVMKTKKRVKCWAKKEKDFRVISEESALNQNSFIETENLVFFSNDGRRCLMYGEEWSIIQTDSGEKAAYLKYINGNIFRESLYVVQWSRRGEKIVGIDWKLNFYVWNVETGKILEHGVLKDSQLGLVESVLLGKDEKCIFLNNQEGDLWRVKNGKLEKINSGCAFGTLRNIDNNTFLAKNCDYTILQIFHSETGKRLKKLISIEGITILGASFNNADFGGDTELREWIVANGGVL